jgi:hypothetical protein
VSFEFREAEPGREGTETWRKLDVTFPSGFPTHSRAQSFYFDEKGDLRRHEYFADVFGGKASAHYCERYREYSGLRVATRRRVYPTGGPRTTRRQSRPITGCRASEARAVYPPPAPPR